MTVDILCKVVDNLGDIGFAYRLARALSELPEPPALRLIVDDLEAFAGLCPGVNPEMPLQRVGEWTVARWESPGAQVLALYLAERPRAVIECYACGRPDWLEAILFDADDPVPRAIVNLEYLTAEPWARDFHRLPSMTRSPLVRKAVFMPGFEPGTGGLIQDRAFTKLISECASADGLYAVRRAALDALSASCPSALPAGFDLASAFWFLAFSYEHDFTAIVADLARFGSRTPVLALVAAGRSSSPFLDAWNRAGRPFPVLELPLVPQPLWDRLLVASDFAVVRGEESFARACLSGQPFLWECYPFADEPVAQPNAGGVLANGGVSADRGVLTNDHMDGHLPKVHAFLDRIRPYLPPEDYARYEGLTLAFNGARGELSECGELSEPGELLSILRAVTPRISVPRTDTAPESEKTGFSTGFAEWALEVRNLGNLAANLMTFLRDLV
jgi:uncharacterized repeat protein (TIGR03837 family)